MTVGESVQLLPAVQEVSHSRVHLQTVALRAATAEACRLPLRRVPVLVLVASLAEMLVLAREWWLSLPECPAATEVSYRRSSFRVREWAPEYRLTAAMAVQRRSSRSAEQLSVLFAQVRPHHR